MLLSLSLSLSSSSLLSSLSLSSVVLFDEREGMWSRNREWDTISDGDWLTVGSLGISK